MKTCPGCSQELSSDSFYKNSARKDGIDSHCKQCSSTRKKKFRENNSGHFSDRDKEYRNQDGYKEKQKERTSKWYVKNKDKSLKNGRAWRELNLERARKLDRMQSHKRRALILGNGHSPYTEEQVLETYGTNCNICSLPVDLKAARKVGLPGWENGLHIDHVLPISKGGPDTLENVRPTHGLCNITKNNKEQYEVQTA